MDSLNATLNAWAPRVLSVLRIMFALVLLQHAFVKLFGFPMSVNFAPVGSLPWIAAIIELVTGLLILAGFLTRPAAFVLAGTMAAAYFIGHAGRGFYPIQNGGNLAILMQNEAGPTASGAVPAGVDWSAHAAFAALASWIVCQTRAGVAGMSISLTP